MNPKQEVANNPLALTSEANLRSSLRAYARRHLPETMVPSRFVVLSELPKLPNGKVDRKALASSTEDLPSADASYVAPRNDLETELCQIWQDVLGLSAVGVESSFFDLGGDSLAIIQISAQIRERYGVRIELHQLVENPTIAHLRLLLGDVDGDSSLPDVNPLGVDTDSMRHDVTSALNTIETSRPRLPAAEGPHSILLTGGTGYTGAFILRELLDRSTATVHVIARAQSDLGASQRVQANMDEFGVLQPGDVDRVVGHCGDTSRPYLGLQKSSYQDLASTITTIVHNAAVSSWILPYENLKPTNVYGTQEVLRLAVEQRTKAVHFVSTIGAYPIEAGPALWPEEPINVAENVLGGYRQTKWVADSLTLAAQEFGIPTHVYRLGVIGGSSKTGAGSSDTFMSQIIKGCIQLGAYLDHGLPVEIVPVDYCAAAIAHSTLTGPHEQSVFNVPGARTILMNDLFELVAAAGYPLECLDYQSWRARLLDAVERGEPNELTKTLPLFASDAPVADMGSIEARPAFVSQNIRDVTAGTSLVCPPVNQDLIDTYIAYFVATGYLPAPSFQLSHG